MSRAWKAALAAAAIVGWAAAAAAAGAGEGADLLRWTRPEAERFLLQAAVLSVEKDAQPGRSLPWIVTLEKDGVRAKAIFKYVNRPRPHPQAHSYRYELAAYELSKLVEMEIVPPTVARTIEGTEGALQLYVENCISERDLARTGLTPPDPRLLRDSLDAVRLFEGLTGDGCGNKDDTYIHKDTWKACRVDLSEAFPLQPTLSEDCILERCPRALYEKMLRMDPASTKKKLREWLSADEVEALCARKRQIVNGLMQLIKDKGEAAVLYGPAPRP